jgi:hypothetical protein
MEPADRAAGRVTSVPDITRLLARIAEWQEGHGKALGRAETARRLDEARKLFEEMANLLTELRRAMLVAGEGPGGAEKVNGAQKRKAVRRGGVQGELSHNRGKS